MNTDNQTAAPHQAQPDAFSDSPHSTPPESPANPVEPSEIPTPDETSLSTWRHNGKVARLPKALRDKINLMLQDGATYPAIINTLGEAGKDLNVMNLSRWKDNGYKDWLLEQSWLNQTRARQEPASDLSTDFDATQLNHAALQLATL